MYPKKVSHSMFDNNFGKADRCFKILSSDDVSNQQLNLIQLNVVASWRFF